MRCLLAIVALSLLASCELGLDDADDGPPTSRCEALDLEGCRADPGCVADTCLNCSCTPSFAGCRAVDGAAHACPELGCAQPACCRSQDECVGGGLCAIEPPPGCGACMPGPGDCGADRECVGGEICEAIACSCDGARRCVAGCEATGCDLGEVCDPASHRCAEQPCSAARTECPANFVCTWPEGGCLRGACTSDGNCPAGYCALGLCQESLGTCYQPPS